MIVFRVDSSEKIGSGHLMRCLALAEELRRFGNKVEFVARKHKANLSQKIIQKGFKVYLLNKSEAGEKLDLEKYEKWLGVKQNTDADQTIQLLRDKEIDWLIVDHYAIDFNWEKALRPYTKKIMVIDDLANRKHDCDILLDQNYINDDRRYSLLTNLETIKLLGPKYALLRQEFSKNIQNRRRHGEIKKVFVYFGASDPNNLIGMALKVFTHSKLKYLSVDLVIGLFNPRQLEIERELEKFPNINLHVQIDNISDLMLKADLALGAGGSTTWERMALGLPSIVITTADNQIAFTKELYNDGFIDWLGNSDQMSMHKISNAIINAINNTNELEQQSKKCQQLVDGKGIKFVSKLLTASHN